MIFITQNKPNAKGTVKHPTVGSMGFLACLFAVFMAAYVIFMPPFEGADEPEHLRYIDAVKKGEKIHPIDRQNPRRYGFEVYQPPLYYHLTGFAARFLPEALPEYIPVNSGKNPYFPFFVHGRPDGIFPFDAQGKVFHLFRAFSAVLGLLAFYLFSRIVLLAIPDAPKSRLIVLLIFVMWPNNIRMFSVVSNDALAYTLSLAIILSALRLYLTPLPTWKHGLILGTLVGLGLATKLTIVVTIVALCPLFIVHVIGHKKRAIQYLAILPAFVIPVFLIHIPFMISMLRWYGTATGGALHDILVPAVVLREPLPLGDVVMRMIQMIPQRFLADLCWQSLTLPVVSSLLFALWMIFMVTFAIRFSFFRAKEPCHETLKCRVFVLSALIIMFTFMLWISSRYVHMQIRHVWSLWPATLLALPLAIKNTRFFHRYHHPRIFKLLFLGLVIVLVTVNVRIVNEFVLRYKPVLHASEPDQNYYTLIENFAKGPPEFSAMIYHGGKIQALNRQGPPVTK